MDGSLASKPTVEELVTKALAAGVITEEFAGELRGCAELSEALGMFYTYIIEEGGDPDDLLRGWGIIESERSGGFLEKLSKGSLIYVPVGAVIGGIVTIAGLPWWAAFPVLLIVFFLLNLYMKAKRKRRGY